jgi:hypothetical protein
MSLFLLPAVTKVPRGGYLKKKMEEKVNQSPSNISKKYV